MKKYKSCSDDATLRGQYVNAFVAVKGRRECDVC